MSALKLKPRSQLIRRGDILALRSARGAVVGFNARSLEVAELAPELWQALAEVEPSKLSPVEREALEELKTWEVTENPNTTHIPAPPAYDVRSLAINVSQICNLACTYCAAGGDGTYGSKVKTPELDRTREQIAMLVGKLSAGDSFNLHFLGGEPLVYPDVIRAIVRDAKLLVAGRGIELTYSIVTNATLIDAKNAELLASLNASVLVSLDGAPEDNDKARVTKGGRGSSPMVLKGLEELLKVRERLHGLTSVSVFGKHQTNMVRAWEFLSAFPFDSMKFEFAAETGDEEISREFAKQLSEIAELAFQKGGERELRRIHAFNVLFTTLDNQTLIKNHCLAGKTHLQLDTSGKFSACPWFIGQKDEELGEGTTLNASRLADYAAPLIEKNGCGSCWARHLCGGGCMYVNKVKTGSKHKVDQAYCERTRTMIAKGIEIYAEARNSNADGNVSGHGASCEVH